MLGRCKLPNEPNPISGHQPKPEAPATPRELRGNVIAIAQGSRELTIAVLVRRGPASSKPRCRFTGDAFRVVYAVHLADEIWVVHAFRKKSTQGIKTPQREIDLIQDRLKRLKEMLR
jgi:phage-related protein